MPNYNIKCTGLELSDEMRAYVEKNLAHSQKFLSTDPAAHIDIELQYLPEGRSGKYRVEFTVLFAGVLHRVERWGGTLHEALDLAGEELAGELRRAKQKRLHVMRRGAHRVKEYLRGWRGSI